MNKNEFLFQDLKASSIYEIIKLYSETEGTRSCLRMFCETETKTYNYREFLALIDLFSDLLLKFGVEKLDRVAFMLNNSPELLACIIAVQKITATPCMMDPGLSPLDLEKILYKISPVALITTTQIYTDKFSQTDISTVALDIERKLTALNTPKIPRKKLSGKLVNNEETALILMTSGTTGHYKGVMLSYKNIIFGINSMRLMSIQSLSKKQFNEDLNVLCILPLYHGMPLILMAFAALCLKNELTLIESIDINLIKRALKLVKPSFFPAVPKLVERLNLGIERNIQEKPIPIRLLVAFLRKVNAMSIGLFNKNLGALFFKKIHDEFGGQLKVISSGGAPLDKLMIQRMRTLGLEVLEAYGLTESTNCSSSNTRQNWRDGSVGMLLPEHEIRFVDPDSKGEGEICLKSPMTMQGYFDEPEATNEVIKDGWLHTGDTGIIKDGFLYITGRIKEMIITASGENVVPANLDLNFLDIKGVAEFATAGLYSPDAHDELIVAGIVLNEEYKDLYQKSEDSRKNIIRLLEASIAERSAVLPPYMHVQHFEVLDSIPRTSLQKVRRKVMAEQIKNLMLEHEAGQPEQNQDSIAASNPISAFIISWMASNFKLPVSSVNADKPFLFYGFDSLSLSSLIQAVEGKFSLRFHPAITREYYTAHLLGDFLWTELNTGGHPVQDGIMVLNTQGLSRYSPAELRKKINMLPPNLDGKESTIILNPKKIFITGVTGYLGAFLVHDLLTSSDEVELCALVRGKNEEAALERIRKNQASYELETDLTRITPVLGDLGTMNLGLSTDEYANIARSVDVIIHNGAQVNFVYDYEELADVNVNGTLEVLKLASHHHLIPVHYVSTTAIFPPTGKFIEQSIKEDTPLDFNEELVGGYPQSKWAAEYIIHEWKEAGLPINVYRPGVIGGSTKTGAWNTDDFTCRFLQGCVQLGAAPDLSINSRLIPVDYVSYFISSLIRTGITGKIFNLVSPISQPYRAVFDYLNKQGFDVKILDYSVWRQKLMNAFKDNNNSLYPLIDFFPTSLDEAPWFKNNMVYDCEQTIAMHLKYKLASLPPIDELMIKRSMDYLIRIGFIEIP